MENSGASKMEQAYVVQPTKKGISGSTLKLIAIITMLIDHTAAIVIDKALVARGALQIYQNDVQAAQQFLSDNGLMLIVNITMRLIGRLAFPIFCFLLIEGFIHTRNKWKYATRLGIFALISEVPFDLAFKGKVLEFSYQNVYFTLLIGLLVMMGFHLVKETLSDKKWLPGLAIAGAVGIGIALTSLYYRLIKFVKSILDGIQNVPISIPEQSVQTLLVPGIIFIGIGLFAFFLICKIRTVKKTSILFTDLLILALGMIAAELLSTDYSALGILTIAVMYWLRKSYVKSMLGGCITLTVINFAEITAFIDLIFIRLYNGTRGLKLKYVFYIFYPAHLLILYLISYFMGIT